MAKKRKQIKKIAEILEKLSYTELIAIYRAICKLTNNEPV